ncbi:MAG: hypothetical protein NVS9B1_10260 [Candidatus Dormibacteraceae bacterium]
MTTNQSTPDIAASIVEQAEELVRLEVALAKQELKELAITNAIAAGSFAGAGLLALLAILVAVPVLLVVAIPIHWLAALVWIVVYLVAALGLYLFGRSKLHLAMPERTLASLKETRNWAIQQMRSRGR